MAHLLTVGWLTLRPREVPWVTAANLRPLATIRAELARGPWEALHTLGWPLLTLAPLGVLLPMAAGRLTAGSPFVTWARTVLTGTLVAFALELLRTTVPGRVLDIDTALLGTAGVALAYAVVVPGLRRLLRRREEAAEHATPKIPRVGMAPRTDALSGPRTYL